jgi:tRNA1Val (adenine37-N6)-methyltransferase
MKVSTDACIFGAWCAPKPTAKKALDIGAGTGILSLMIAQNFPLLEIDAIEIEKKAYTQCTENCMESKFASQIKTWHVNIENWDMKNQYDYIFSNPPYYENDLQTKNKATNLAKHSTELTMPQLFSIVKKCLKMDGEFTCILPIHRLEESIEMAKKVNLFLKHKTLVKHNDKKPFQKVLLIFSQQQMEETTNELVIYDATNNYSTQSITLLAPFYLAL